ncbi:MAG: hypothetical protein NTV04_09215 [Deltaproteobacteria bacterium]|nr:hypothetical protein [Deltaproteobacteria bacterium]
MAGSVSRCGSASFVARDLVGPIPPFGNAKIDGPSLHFVYRRQLRRGGLAPAGRNSRPPDFCPAVRSQRFSDIR